MTNEDDERMVDIDRMCVHCLHEWREQVTIEELREVTDGKAIGVCPNNLCGMPT